MKLKNFVFLVVAGIFFLLSGNASAAQDEKKAATPAEPAVEQQQTATLKTFQPDDAFRKDRFLLDRLQFDAFRYMWEHTFPESGLAYEDSRNKESGQATIGGSGFGVASSWWQPKGAG